MKTNRIIPIFLVLALIGFGIYYFSNTEDDNEKIKTKNELTKIRVGYIPIADCAQLYVANDKGFFKENGLEVEFVKLSGGAKILEALASGSIDIAFSNVVSIMLANNAKLDFKAITGGPRTDMNHKEAGILVLKDSGIKSIKDLDGKRIVINTRKNILELLVSNLLEKNGVSVESISFVEMPFPKMFQVLDSKKVDAIASIEPFLSFSIKTGKVINIGDYFTEVLPNIEISTYDASQKWIDNNLETVNKFIKSIDQATTFSNNNIDDLRTIIANNTSLSIEQVKDMNLPYFGSQVDEESFEKILSLVKEKQWVSQDLKSENIIYRK